LGKVKAIMNEANREVREAARDLVVEILGAIGIAGAFLEQAKPKPPPKAHPRAFGEVG
jgi:hypothetical protein